ncbi:MAG TPA: transcription antitermination factor NusB [Usitatibacter sp.]|nr:transcription antitermination factor NusB [Usitatibacter sp.]
MKVSPRRRSREFAMQGIYQWLYTGNSAADVLKNLSELEDFERADRDFLAAELRGTIGDADELRARIEPFADRKWDEVSPVERAILLLGAWELVHNPEIPYRVTINEAIELGKRFGGTDGHKYVNGVLDKLAAAVRPEEVAEPPAKRAKASSTRRKKNGQ